MDDIKRGGVVPGARPGIDDGGAGAASGHDARMRQILLGDVPGNAQVHDMEKGGTIVAVPDEPKALAAHMFENTIRYAEEMGGPQFAAMIRASGSMFKLGLENEARQIIADKAAGHLLRGNLDEATRLLSNLDGDGVAEAIAAQTMVTTVRDTARAYIRTLEVKLQDQENDQEDQKALNHERTRMQAVNEGAERAVKDAGNLVAHLRQNAGMPSSGALAAASANQRKSRDS